MTAFVIASLAGCNLVLNPTRSALYSRNEMLGGGYNVAVVKCAAAPDAVITVAFENYRHSFTAVRLPTAMMFCR